MCNVRFEKVHGFQLMKVGRIENNSPNKDIIEESIIHHVFDNAPIIYNQNENFKDYRDNNIVEKYVRENVVGVILPNTVNFDGLYVTADVMLLKEFSNRTHFDNWGIEYEKGDCYFNFCFCELFSINEDKE